MSERGVGDDLLVDGQGPVATVTLNRPQTLNAITAGMFGALPGVIDDLNADPTVRVIVLRGAGTRSFAAGADIGEFEQERGDSVRARRYNDAVARAELALEGSAAPIIAMIHGHCIGGGTSLALACDLRLADHQARFAITAAKIGLVYGFSSTKRLVDLVGPSRARWFLMSGLAVTASRALELGLVDELYDTESLEEQTYQLARTIASRAQFSVRAAKQIIGRVQNGQDTDDEVTLLLRHESFDTEDYREGVRAFLDKRPPRFR